MASELELKAVVADPPALRRKLIDAGAREEFRGMLRDRRLDRDGTLSASDRVLRLRHWVTSAGPAQVQVGWKGPTTKSPEGYKLRQELEYSVTDAEQALGVFEALGFRVVQAIDRYVEVYRLADGLARVEWYPRLDVLIELEGSPDGIERLITATGLARVDCLPDPLAAFAARFEARTGRPAVLAESELVGESPGWAGR